MVLHECRLCFFVISCIRLLFWFLMIMCCMIKFTHDCVIVIGQPRSSIEDRSLSASHIINNRDGMRDDMCIFITY